jgi:hypothetical protein
MRRNTQRPRATHSSHPMRTPTPFVLRKGHPSSRSRCYLSCARVLYRPGGGRMKDDQRILGGSNPVNLNLGLRHVTFEQKQPHGRVHSAELLNGMSTKSMERRRRNSYASCVVPVVARSLKGTPPQRSWTGSFPRFASTRLDLVSP